MNQTDQLRRLLGDFIDYEYENFNLQWEILSQGVTSTLNFRHSGPKLSGFLRNSLGLKESETQFFHTSQVPTSLFHKHSNKAYLLLLFGDDYFEITVAHPTLPPLPPMIFSGHYLEKLLKQGINGTLPQILKNGLNRPVGDDPTYRDLDYVVTLKLLTPTSDDTCRAVFLKHLRSQEHVAQRVKELMNPENLFSKLKARKFNNETKFLVRERLRLWNHELPPKITGRFFFEKIVPQLSHNTFGLDDLYLLEPISHNFTNPIDNAVLLTGQCGHFNNYRHQRLKDFYRKLLDITRKTKPI